MTNKDLQKYLSGFPEDMLVKIILDHKTNKVFDFELENIEHTSDTAFADDEAPADEWDTEDGKLMLGDGEKYLLINPPIY